MLLGYPPEAFHYDLAHHCWVLDESFCPQTMLLRLDLAAQARLLNAKDRQIAQGLLSEDIPLFLRRPDGGILRIDRLEIDGRLRLLLPTEPLEPGEIYTEVAQFTPPALPFAANRLHTHAALGAGTMIATEAGEQPIDWLRPGDRILTRDNGYQSLLWIGRVELSEAQGTPAQALYLPDAAFGPAQPGHGMFVTRGQHILLAGPQLHLWFAESEMFARAEDLLALYPTPNCECAPHNQMFLLVCAEPEIILAQGLWVETALPTEPLLAMIDETSRNALRKALAGHYQRQTRASLTRWELALFVPLAQERKRIAA